jgi:hypothetical protein
MMAQHRHGPPGAARSSSKGAALRVALGVFPHERIVRILSSPDRNSAIPSSIAIPELATIYTPDIAG